METLKASLRMAVRFSEVDSMGIVWHGNYVKYLEDAREAFGNKYGIGYLSMVENGYFAPIVSMELKYHNPLVYGDEFIAEAEYVPCVSAKMKFTYRITRVSDGLLVLSGSSVQAFLDLDRNLMLHSPEAYAKWKKEYGMNL